MNIKILAKTRTLGLIFLLTLPLMYCCAGNGAKVSSPDKNISLVLSLDDNGSMNYSVNVGQSTLIAESPLGFVAPQTNLKDGFKVRKVSRSSSDQTWTQPWGENKTIRNNYNEMAVELANKDQARLTLRFRLFDDGLGFRYEYNTKCDSIDIMDELTSFNIAEKGTSWSIPAHFDTYELLYRTLPIDEVDNANTPFTFKTNSGIYASIHEAALTDFAEMTLERDSNRLKSDLAPWPNGVKVKKTGNFITPWRTIQIGQKAVDLINSALILNLNEPCVLETTDWIRPMKYVGVWWSMHVGIDSWTMDERHGATTVNAKRYIDFAAQNNIEGVLFEGWNEGWESWGGRQNFDFTKPYADFDIVEIVRYAKDRNIEIIGHHETGGNIPNYERQLDTAYKWYADLGIHCVKTGYAGGFPDGLLHHGQYGVRHYRNVVITAAKYHTTLDVHEPIKATGIRRTYPNMMTREGARGMEWDAWSTGNPPEHYELLPFTRLLAGPMDYTPGTFDILFEKTRNHPQRKLWNGENQGVNTTLAKQLANWVVLYSPLQMASDMIEHYEGHPAFQFFRDFDPDCDWSKALAGEPAEFVAVVRKAKESYFLGATTNEQPRTISVSLDFLEPGIKYNAVIYADGADANWKTNPTSYTITQQQVSSSDSLDIVMVSGGGQAISFMPIKI